MRYTPESSRFNHPKKIGKCKTNKYSCQGYVIKCPKLCSFYRPWVIGFGQIIFMLMSRGNQSWPRPLALVSRQSANNKGDNGVKPRALQRSLAIYLMAEENPGKPEVRSI